MTPQFTAPAVPEAQFRLLILCLLLLGTTVVTRDDSLAMASEPLTVFEEPPAYLHPRAAIGFDLSGLPTAHKTSVEAALIASAQDASNVDARAHTHMSLAVYYKLQGQESRAAAEKRKGDYWWRVARMVDGNKLDPRWYGRN